jgi:hypothetical protein
MDSRRAETYEFELSIFSGVELIRTIRLEALSAYLQNQRSFLARTQADIERLKQLKSEALASPQQFVSSNSEVSLPFLPAVQPPVTSSVTFENVNSEMESPSPSY